MINNGSFVVHGKFGGNRYGFSKRELGRVGKHLVVTTWSETIPEFAVLPNIMLIGMQAPPNWKDILGERMRRRGEEESAIQKRFKYQEQDIAYLKKYKDLIMQSGHCFAINDDTTVPEKVIPWIQDKLGL